MRVHRFVTGVVAGLIAAVSISVGAIAGAPQHKDPAPGYFRLKVGGLEVVSLFDGSGAFQLGWLKGKPDEIAAVRHQLRANPHFLDGDEAAFLVNTGTKLILIDAGAGNWFGGGEFGHLQESLRQAGYTPDQIDMVLVTHLHSDHIGGLTTKDGARAFPNADIWVAKAESDFWLSKDVEANAPKDAVEFFDAAQAIAAPYIKAGKWRMFTPADKITDGLEVVPLVGHTPGHTGYEFTSEGHRILFAGDLIHSIPAQLSFPAITAVFDIDESTDINTRAQELQVFANQDVIIAGAHFAFPSMGRVYKIAGVYQWNPVALSNRWEER